MFYVLYGLYILYINHIYHYLYQIDPELVLPTIRAATEKLLELIAQGKQDFQAVLDHSVKTFEMKYKYFVSNITGMDELFEVSFSPLASTGKPLSRYALAHCALWYGMHWNEVSKQAQNYRIDVFNFSFFFLNMTLRFPPKYQWI